MSCLTTETREALVIILHTSRGDIEIAEYDYDDCSEGARARAHEEVSDYVAKTGEYVYCTIEHRVIPIYR